MQFSMLEVTIVLSRMQFSMLEANIVLEQNTILHIFCRIQSSTYSAEYNPPHILQNTILHIFCRIQSSTYSAEYDPPSQHNTGGWEPTHCVCTLSLSIPPSLSLHLKKCSVVGHAGFLFFVVVFFFFLLTGQI